jgi:hypothetical protein
MGRMHNLTRVEEKLPTLHIEVVVHKHHFTLIMEVLDRGGRMAPCDGVKAKVLDLLERLNWVFEWRAWRKEDGSPVAQDWRNWGLVSEKAVLLADAPARTHDCLDNWHPATACATGDFEMG